MNKSSRGFTIVELLVVIVVIGILAAITIVSFTGVSQRATISSIQSDLGTGSKSLKLYYTEHGSYPLGLKNAAFNASNCPISPNTDPQYCLKLSGNNEIDYYFGTATSFVLRIKNGALIYVVTENNSPVAYVPFNLTVTAGSNGSVSGGGVYDAGTVQTIVATPNSGYAFSSWTGTAGCSGTASHTITMDSNKTCTANFVFDPWIAGKSSTVMYGKYVYYQDLSPTYYWQNNEVNCPTGTGGSQPCQIGLDPDYPTKAVLVSPQTYPALNFSAYPSQNACKLVGGRLPIMRELISIYNERLHYGNNLQASAYYSSATEMSNTNHAALNTYSVEMNSIYKFNAYNDHHLRCVKD